MSKKPNVSLVVGARPNFIKVAPLVRQFENENIDVDLIHTGQHWDEKLSNEIFQYRLNLESNLKRSKHRVRSDNSESSKIISKGFTSFFVLLRSNL